MAAGGLFVIGTERHESRRIDNQLRGRSGRQGDPGRSLFYLSLEDDLMRIFGSERMDSMLQKLGLKEGEAIVHPWINKALEKAQQKVEARNFDIRKNLLKFDNVMNDQRKVIFEQRIGIMKGEDVAETIDDMRHQVIDDLITKHIPENAYAEQWDAAGLRERLREVDRPSISRSRTGPRKKASPTRKSASASTKAADELYAGKAREIHARDHAAGREGGAAADPRPALARPHRHRRASAPGHPPARLRPARSAQRIQDRRLHPVRGDDRAACAR